MQNEKCVAFGPGVDMFDSTRIIGEKQFNMGKVSLHIHLWNKNDCCSLSLASLAIVSL